MANSLAFKLAFLALVCMVVGAPFSQATISSCSQVTQYVGPCIPYFKSGGAVPPACCQGIINLNGAARTTPDRRTACTCLVNTATTTSGLKPNLVSGLPGVRGVRLPYPMGPNTKCNRTFAP
ncbi:non-specific lipid-transfer protein 1-like [Pyrus ussuriensis x Pyrus communis]|uniref:Non-specific lipid-transfer protein n=1 Tax=Pyrus ussuriensis x Pyrus communis TaxID=2448454 RepID=A0A5N5H1Q5_9ROSA|nr:non-specific lipid-transfer protein 1-like [Pyrus ussuriensis x Pyrus communis]